MSRLPVRLARGGLNEKWGIRFHNEIRDHIRIQSASAGSPAERSGLRPGDVVEQLNGQPVQGWTLQQLVGQLSTALQFEVGIYRAAGAPAQMQQQQPHGAPGYSSAPRYGQPGAAGHAPYAPVPGHPAPARPPQGYAGYSSPRPPMMATGFGAPPPTGYAAAPDPMYQQFRAVAGADGRVSAEELAGLLASTGLGAYPRQGHRFDTETCRQIISMVAIERKNFTLSFPEFQQALRALEAWKQSFQRHDRDRSGTIEHRELKGLFHEMRFNVSDRAVDVCVKRYSARSNGQVGFDDFISCAIRLRTISEAFKSHDRELNGWATLHYDEFMAIGMMN